MAKQSYRSNVDYDKLATSNYILEHYFVATSRNSEFIISAQEERIEKELEKMRRKELKKRRNEIMSYQKKNYQVPKGYVGVARTDELTSKKAYAVLRTWCAHCWDKQNCNNIPDLVSLMGDEEFDGVDFESIILIKPREGGKSIPYCKDASKTSIVYFEDKQRKLKSA